MKSARENSMKLFLFLVALFTIKLWLFLVRAVHGFLLQWALAFIFSSPYSSSPLCWRSLALLSLKDNQQALFWVWKSKQCLMKARFCHEGSWLVLVTVFSCYSQWNIKWPSSNTGITWSIGMISRPNTSSTWTWKWGWSWFNIKCSSIRYRACTYSSSSELHSWIKASLLQNVKSPEHLVSSQLEVKPIWNI